jgi:hypothetical protein
VYVANKHEYQSQGELRTHLSYNETKVYIQKHMMSVKYRHLLLLFFYKLFIPIYAFLPALQYLKNASAIEVRSRPSQGTENMVV